MTEPSINKEVDWTALDFTCTEEQNPPVDAEADKWFKEARAIQKGERPGSNALTVELYEKSAERQHYKALNNLALIYGYGDIGKPKEHRAVELIEQGMALEAPICYYTMGIFFVQGIGVEQDRIAALPYFRKAADMGNRYGQYLVGEKLLNSSYSSPDGDKIFPVAIKMLECSLEQGYSKAGIELGAHFATEEHNKEHNKEQSLVYFQKAAALGNSLALYSLQIAFQEGTEGANKDPKRAGCYKQLIAELSKDKTKTFPDIDTLCPLPAGLTE